MARTADNADRINSLLILAAAVCLAVFNWNGRGLDLSGPSTAVFASGLMSALVPSLYAFTIWTTIYVALIAAAVLLMVAPSAGATRATATLFILSCVLNVLWQAALVRGQLWWATLAAAGLLAVLIYLAKRLVLEDRTAAGLAFAACIGGYIGWFLLLAIATLFRGLGLDPALGDGISLTTGLGALALAAVAAVAVRWRLPNYIAPLATAWGLTAIAVANGGRPAIVVMAGLGVIACLIASASFVMAYEPRQPYEQR